MLTLYIEKGMFKPILPQFSKEMEEDVWYDVTEASYELNDASEFRTLDDAKKHLATINNLNLAINKYGNLEQLNTQIAYFESNKPIFVSNQISDENDGFDFASNTTSTIELGPKEGNGTQSLKFKQKGEQVYNLLLEGYQEGTIFAYKVNQTSGVLSFKPLYFTGSEPEAFKDLKNKGPFVEETNISEIIKSADNIQPIEIANCNRGNLKIRYNGNYYDGSFKLDAKANPYIIGDSVNIKEQEAYNATEILQAAQNILPIDLGKYNDNSAIEFSELQINPYDAKNVEFVKSVKDGKYGILMHDKLHNIRIVFFNFEDVSVKDDNFEIKFKGGHYITLGDLRSLKIGLHKFYHTKQAHSNMNSTVSYNLGKEKMKVYETILPKHGTVKILLEAGKVTHLTIPSDALIESCKLSNQTIYKEHEKDMELVLRYPNNATQKVILHGGVYKDPSTPHHGIIISSGGGNRTVWAGKMTEKYHSTNSKKASQSSTPKTTTSKPSIQTQLNRNAPPKNQGGFANLLFLEGEENNLPGYGGVNNIKLSANEPIEVKTSFASSTTPLTDKSEESSIFDDEFQSQIKEFNIKAEEDIKQYIERRNLEEKQAEDLKRNPLTWAGLGSVIGGTIGSASAVLPNKRYTSLDPEALAKKMIVPTTIGAAIGAAMGGLVSIGLNRRSVNIQDSELWAMNSQTDLEYLLEENKKEEAETPEYREDRKLSLYKEEVDEEFLSVTNSANSIHQGILPNIFKAVKSIFNDNEKVNQNNTRECKPESLEEIVKNIDPISEKPTSSKEKYEAFNTENESKKRVKSYKDKLNNNYISQTVTQDESFVLEKYTAINSQDPNINQSQIVINSVNGMVYKQFIDNTSQGSKVTYSADPTCMAPELTAFTEMGLPQSCITSVDEAKGFEDLQLTKLQANLNDNFNAEFKDSLTQSLSHNILKKAIYTGKREDIKLIISVAMKTALSLLNQSLTIKSYISDAISIISQGLKGRFPKLDEALINKISRAVTYSTIYGGILISSGGFALPSILASELGIKIGNAVFENAPNLILYLPEKMQNNINNYLKRTDVAIESIVDSAYKTVGSVTKYTKESIYNSICKPLPKDTLFEDSKKTESDKFWEYFGKDTNNRANQFLQKAKKIISEDKIDDLTEFLFKQAENLREARKMYFSNNSEGFEGCLKKLFILDLKIQDILYNKIEYKNFTYADNLVNFKEITSFTSIETEQISHAI